LQLNLFSLLYLLIMPEFTISKTFFLFLLFFIIPLGLFSQNFSLTGYVSDINSGEELLFASITTNDNTKGTVSNEYGFYSLTLPKGKYKIIFSYSGYQKKEIEIELYKSFSLNVGLKQIDNEVEEVVVTGERSDKNVTGTEVGTIQIDLKESKLVPVIFGEQDIFKSMQLLPGISSGSDGNSGFFVRGGDSDQNLILLDEAPVYNASHLLGFFSVFNSDAIKDLKIYKGGVPAQYGGRIASVTDIRMKNGNLNRWETSGGIGLISSRLTVEGPVFKNKSSVIFSARRTYADLLVKAFKKEYTDLNLYFFDLNAKANIKFGNKNRLFLSGYWGRDIFGMDFIGFDWGNKTATIRLNHIFNASVFSNTTFIYSDYNYGFDAGFNNFNIALDAGIYDYNFKQDYNWYLKNNRTISFGWQSIYHRFKPMGFKIIQTADSLSEDKITETKIDEQKALESSFYFAEKHTFNNELSAEYGIRFNLFNNIGYAVEKTYNESGEVVDSVTHKNNEFYHHNFCFEPRINITYLINKTSSFKASYSKIGQFLHLLSNSTSGSPTDMWIPSSEKVLPEISNQFSFGYFRNFSDNNYELSFEGFYKLLSNQVDYKDGADAFGNPDIENELVLGKGRAYGLEFFLKRNYGNLNGWISYTLLKSERQFDEINFGLPFSARQDRTHDFSLVLTYKFNPQIISSVTWVYNTGDAVTFPAGKYQIDGQIINLYTERNGDRMPDYHRMDFGITFIFNKNKRFYNELNISAFNVYNRKNAYSITFKTDEQTGKTEAERLALFGIVPSVSWNFKF